MSAEIPPLAGAAGDGDDAAVVLNLEFGAATLHVLREAVEAHAVAAGMPADRAVDVMLAVHELASNAVRHGGGSGRLRMQVTGGALRCQVSDAGRASGNGQGRGQGRGRGRGGAAGGAGPWPCVGGHGLWLVRQAADHLSVVSGAGGSVVTVVFGLPAAATAPGSAGGRGVPGVGGGRE